MHVSCVQYLSAKLFLSATRYVVGASKMLFTCTVLRAAIGRKWSRWSNSPYTLSNERGALLVQTVFEVKEQQETKDIGKQQTTEGEIKICGTAGVNPSACNSAFSTGWKPKEYLMFWCFAKSNWLKGCHFHLWEALGWHDAVTSVCTSYGLTTSSTSDMS